jgi:hypothetical protein
MEELIMNKDIKTQWVGALRSGEYTQGIGQLREGSEGEAGAYCCLGVLCELYDKAMGGDCWEYGSVETPNGFQQQYTHKGENNYPSCEVMDWAGLWVTESESIDGEGLVSANDGGQSFEEIADIIESSL